MESFSSEIGKKMRSAVKAKLIELGTESGTAGYVDDELPDYVMIMVANKRSKQQMTTDLNLFLGNKTELFVTWLHEVLQKLQEVTVPAPSAKKRKPNQKEETASKKDKKSTKKEKTKTTKKTNEPTTLPTEKPPSTLAISENSTSTLPPAIGNITDVFAEDLLEKAKHNLDATADAASHIKKGKAKRPTAREGQNEFDIPTISEISSTTAVTGQVISGNREKDLAELAEIQKKIYAAKKHLKELGQHQDFEESDEEGDDFLKLRDEGSSDELSDENDNRNNTNQSKPKPATKEKSPIVFDKKQEPTPEKSHTPPLRGRVRSPLRTTNSSEGRAPLPFRNNENVRKPAEFPSTQRSRDRERREASPTNKRPVHERLGLKPQQSTDQREQKEQQQRAARREKELYVPAHRRQETPRSERDHKPERWRSRERDDDKRRNDRQRVEKTPERSTRNTASTVKRIERKDSKRSGEDEGESPRTPVVRHRVGSRVIVAPTKPQVESSDEEVHDKPVNSVIKIKPRPPVSPSRQACKNLLLRAVAEAQRSTILSKTAKASQLSPEGAQTAAAISVAASTTTTGKVKDRLGGRAVKGGNEALFTKILRERRLKRNAPGIEVSTLFRRQTSNLIVKVDGELQTKRRRTNSQSPTNTDEEEAYEPESLDQDYNTTVKFAYKPIRGEIMYDGLEEAEDYQTDEEEMDEFGLEKTQFVVTLNDNKTSAQKFRTIQRSRSTSPQPQVTSSSSITRNGSIEPTSTTHFNRNSRAREPRRSDIRARLSKRPATPLSPSRAPRVKERESLNSSPSSGNTPPPQRLPRRAGFIDVYRKTKDVKKIIIKNDSDDEEMSSPVKQTPERNRKRLNSAKEDSADERSLTPPLPKNAKMTAAISAVLKKKEQIVETTVPTKSRHTPIRFDLEMERPRKTPNKNEIDDHVSHVNPFKTREETSKCRSKSRDRSKSHDEILHRSHSREVSVEQQSCEERKRISIRGEVNNKYDNIPSLSSFALDSSAGRAMKPKERCKYHPNCTKQFCDYYHPTAPCKAFPNCKYADKCLYSHPKCKYDMACTVLDCIFSHSGVRNPSQLQPTAPPLSSHVVPVQNYKSISASAGASSAMCKYFPNCSKAGCTFYHPKACRFGKNCINKLECNFYHHELQSSNKFKWVASAT